VSAVPTMPSTPSMPPSITTIDDQLQSAVAELQAAQEKLLQAVEAENQRRAQLICEALTLRDLSVCLNCGSVKATDKLTVLWARDENRLTGPYCSSCLRKEKKGYPHTSISLHWCNPIRATDDNYVEWSDMSLYDILASGIEAEDSIWHQTQVPYVDSGYLPPRTALRIRGAEAKKYGLEPMLEVKHPCSFEVTPSVALR
jgi:hypothetical protein